MSNDAETPPLKRDARDEAGRFLPGNPGRPRGAKHAALRALDAIGEEGAERVLRKVQEMAEGGDMRAAEILLRRIWPERKGRPVLFTLPEVRTAADAAQALGAVASAVAAGDLTPEEGHSVAAVVEAHRRTIETAELAARIATLEARQDGRSG